MRGWLVSMQPSRAVVGWLGTCDDAVRRQQKWARRSHNAARAVTVDAMVDVRRLTSPPSMRVIGPKCLRCRPLAGHRL